MLAPILTACIVLGYAASLWWLLRRERLDTVLWLAIICALSLCLRLVYTTYFPEGLNEDEPNVLVSAMGALRTGRLFGESSLLLPVLLNALFQGQLVPLFGPTRWAIRTYSLVTSVLATPAAFAVSRSFGLRVGSGLAAGALVAVLPPLILYGRVHIGGELVFHELLLLAALARIVWRNGKWPEISMGAFALCLLLYDYWAGLAMLGMPLVAAVLARGRQRLWCVLVLALALAGFTLHWPNAMTSNSKELLSAEIVAHPVQELTARTLWAAEALVWPVASNSWLTISAGAVSPPAILALAVLGIVLSPPRRGLFLLAGFLGGLVPTVFGAGPPSTHRMIMAYVFIPLAAVCPLEWLRWRHLRLAVTALVVALISFQSVRMYFSRERWSSPDTRGVFDWQITAALEALPPSPHPKFIISKSFSYHFDPRSMVDKNFEFLSPENWFPANGKRLIYAFEYHSGLLRPFYEHLFGYERVESYGSAFLVRLEPADWSWLRQHGWAHEARCAGQAWSGQVPTLFHQSMPLKGLHCEPPVTHVWRARWDGPDTTLGLRWNGTATVAVNGMPVVDKAGYEQGADFTAPHGAVLTVTVTADQGVVARLVELTPAGERLPDWELLTPVADGSS
jgi:hypothetical protein